jgi:uncharacterized protein (TIGR04551 family)
MARLVAALAALALLAPAARAQEAKKPDERKEAATAGELDPATKAAIAREVERAKEELRDEVRAEIQGAQSAAEFLGAVAEGPKLEFLQLDGYHRVRGQLLTGLDLGRGADASGFFLFPVPIQNPDPTTGARAARSTLATANMRLRLEPTLNVSELVRVRAQIDVLDNYVLGSTTSVLQDLGGSPYPIPFYGSTRVLERNDPTLDRDAILPKRVWGEVQTPVGLLSFGRMPSEWGLGILANAGAGIDDDFGDTVDRIQFALPPVQTPVGGLTLVPMLDFDAEGALQADPRFGPGLGQPFDAESGDDARTWAFKAARLDTEDEVRRKLERNELSFNFGAYYSYRTQRGFYPEWLSEGFGLELPAGVTRVDRRSYGHFLDGWARLLTPRWRFEVEAVGVIGNVGAAFSPLDADGSDVTPPTIEQVRVLLRQYGAVALAEYRAIPNKVLLGAEVGLASGDPAPGFGNDPTRLQRNGNLPEFGSLEGPQFNAQGDRFIRNYRFNPAYRVDLVLWRNILGGVTDAWYLKPRIRWDIFPGLAFDGALVYSQALLAGSTPSANEAGGGSQPLGVEVDAGLTYTSGTGFQAYAQYGILQPLSAFGPAETSRAHVLGFGLAARF